MFMFLRTHYATSHPKAWILHVMGVHSLANNITVISKHCIGDSGHGQSFPVKSVGAPPLISEMR